MAHKSCSYRPHYFLCSLANNKNGISVYSYNKAWGKKEDEILTHNDIIIHLRKAFDNWIAFENKSNEHQYPKSEQYLINQEKYKRFYYL
jgi:hypothetical protein